MARRRDNLVPDEPQDSRRWTRFADYWPNADDHIREAAATAPGKLAAYGSRPRHDAPRPKRRGFLIPILAVLVAIGVSLWASGWLQGGIGRTSEASSRSRGLVFGSCGEGGVTNCVVSGDTFYLGGKTVRIAGIEAPQVYGATCPKEAELGRASARRLQALLNSGEIEMTKVAPDLDRYGLLLRTVSINGKEVGREMVDAGFARNIGDMTRSWC